MTNEDEKHLEFLSKLEADADNLVYFLNTAMSAVEDVRKTMLHPWNLRIGHIDKYREILAGIVHLNEENIDKLKERTIQAVKKHEQVQAEFFEFRDMVFGDALTERIKSILEVVPDLTYDEIQALLCKLEIEMDNRAEEADEEENEE